MLYPTVNIHKVTEAYAVLLVRLSSFTKRTYAYRTLQPMDLKLVRDTPFSFMYEDRQLIHLLSTVYNIGISFIVCINIVPKTGIPWNNLEYENILLIQLFCTLDHPLIRLRNQMSRQCCRLCAVGLP